MEFSQELVSEFYRGSPPLTPFSNNTCPVRNTIELRTVEHAISKKNPFNQDVLLFVIDTIFKTATTDLFKNSPFVNCDKAHDSLETLFVLLEASPLMHQWKNSIPTFL